MPLSTAPADAAIATAQPERAAAPLRAAAPKPALWRRLAPYAAAALGAVPMAYSWLHKGFPAGAWIGMFVLAALTVGRPAHIVFRRGIVFGLVGTILAFHWVPEVLGSEFGLRYITILIWFLLAAACEAFHFLLAVYLAARLATPKVWGSLLFPLCFIALEFVWIRLFPWRLAHSQIAWTSFIQIAEVTGAYGVGFVMLWVVAVAAGGLNQFVARYRGQAPLCRVSRWEAAACLAVFAGTLAFGVWRSGNIEAAAAAQPTLRVALVQVDLGQKDAHDKLIELSQNAAEQVDLVCWPESSVAAFSSSLRDFRKPESLAGYSRFPKPDAPLRPWENPSRPLLCAGKSYSEGAPEVGPYYVSAFLIDRQEQIAGLYYKRSLMPFGEYIPVYSWLSELVGRAPLGNITARGTEPRLIKLPGQAQIGTLICYEDMVEGEARQSVRAGAEILVALANGSSFGETEAPVQQRQTAHFRAIENRRYLLRCTATGSTSVISPTGKLVAELPRQHDGTLIAAAQPLDVVTFYTRFGNVFAYLCLAAVGVLGVWRWRAHSATKWRDSKAQGAALGIEART